MTIPSADVAWLLVRCSYGMAYSVQLMCRGGSTYELRGAPMFGLLRELSQQSRLLTVLRHSPQTSFQFASDETRAEMVWHERHDGRAEASDGEGSTPTSPEAPAAPEEA